jgi:hypothetical protein
MAEPGVRVAVTSISIDGNDLSVEIADFTFMANEPDIKSTEFISLQGSSDFILLHNNQFIAEQYRYSHLLHMSGGINHSSVDELETDSEKSFDHQELVLNGNTFKGFSSDVSMSLNDFKKLSLRNNEFINNYGVLLIQGSADLSGNLLALKNNLFRLKTQNIMPSAGVIKVHEVDFVEVSFNSILGHENYSSDLHEPTFQFSNSQSWVLDFHHNDLYQSYHSLWIGLFGTLKSDSIVQDNLWPQLVSSDDFMIRTDDNNNLHDPINVQFYDSEDSFMKKLAQ